MWVYISTYSGKLLVFLSTVILARLLSKEDFGVAGYALVAISFLDVMADMGIGPALIFHRANPEVNDTAFWLNLVFAATLFGATWLLAPLVGILFNDQRAVDVTRVLALTFPLSAIGNVHNALIQKQLRFRRKFVPDLVQALGKGLTSITFALLGFGPWSLIIGQLGGTAAAQAAYWWSVPWRPRWRFNGDDARALLSYGTNIVAVNFLGVLLLNVDYLFVGRYLGPVMLGVYTLAFRVPELLINQFCGLLSKVLFPVYTSIRDDLDALRRGVLLTMRYVTLVTFPVAIGLALTAQPFVVATFGEKWADAAAVMPAIAIYTLLRSLSFNIGDIYKAQGRPGLLTKLSLPRLVIIPALWWAVTVPGTIVAVGWVQAAVALATMLLNLVVATRLLQTPLRSMLQAWWPACVGSLAMTPAVIATLQLLAGTNPWVQLLGGAAVGAAVYVGTLWLLFRETVVKVGSTLRSALARR